jgi:O-antigen/teichoic acid export membrane protein
MTSVKESQLAKDSLWMLIARLSAQGALALFTILIARRLGSTGFGEYAFIASAVVIGNMLTSFGTDMLLIREIAARRDFSQLIPSLLLQLSLSAGLIALAWVLPPLPGQSSPGWLALKIYSLALIPVAFFTVFSSVLRGLQRMDQYAVLNLVTSLFQLAATFFFIQAGSSVVALAWLLLAVQVAAAVLAGWLCRDQFPNFRRPVQFSLRQFQPVLPLAALGILGILYQRLGILMVTFWLGAAATGWFSAALRTVEFAKTAHLAVFTVLYPAMAKSQDGWKDFRNVWLILLIGAFAAALGISLLASPLTLILFGAEYAASIPLLRLLAWMLVPFTVSTSLTLAFVAANRERPVLMALTASLLMFVLLNSLWTPSLGVLGAGRAMLLSECLQAGMLLFQYLKKSLVVTTPPASPATVRAVPRSRPVPRSARAGSRERTRDAGSGTSTPVRVPHKHGVRDSGADAVIRND